MNQIRFRLGLGPHPLDLTGRTSKGREGRKDGREGQGRGEGRGGDPTFMARERRGEGGVASWR